MYIAGIIGPYFSGGDRRLIDINIANARSIGIKIANYFANSKLVGFWCPHTHTAEGEVMSEAPEPYYHALDDAIYYRACDCFILLPGWQHSSGATRDRENALKWSRHIFGLKSYEEEDIADLLHELEQWAKETKESC